MRVAIVHVEYQMPGGEDVVARNEAELLRRKGHEVIEASLSNKNISRYKLPGRLLSLLRGVWWSKGAKSLAEELGRFHPDVVHIHNLWFQSSPALIREISRLQIPVVMTLHNFRLMCVNGILFRKGAICRKCLKRSRFWGVVHGCYRRSRFLSFCVFSMASIGWKKGIWQDYVQKFICLTPFSRELFLQAGFPPEKITVKPNFIPSTDLAGGNNWPDKYVEPTAVFVGRLSQEKGILFLLKEWERRAERLILIGSSEAPIQLPSNVHLMGQLSRKDVLSEIAKSWVLIAPSEWHETFGLTLIEAFAVGTPVLASLNGTYETIVEDGKNGMTFPIRGGAEFHLKLNRLMQEPQLRGLLSENAKADFSLKYSDEPAYKSLRDVYQSAIRDSRK